MEASLTIKVATFNDESLLKRLNESVATVKKHHHQAMQACTWSGTPSFHRQCVTAMIDIVVPVSVAAPKACRLGSCHAEQFKPEENVRFAFASVAKDRDCRHRKDFK